jgi:cytochrome c-type biogenesis protein CcmH
MKCQNQSIADSPIDVAADLRRQVRDMLASGQSDAAVKDYLASRYGDFILYRPPLKPTTWVLWAGPALLLLIGGFIFGRIVRSRTAQLIDEEAGP